jgi:hypothetical protein
MAEAKPQSLALETSDRRLRVEFHWQRDRFIQQLFVDSVEAGNSIEGDAEDAWPSSPPLQQLSLEDINGSRVILGVGAAGRGHWSISVEIDQQNDGAGAIKFELACRSKQQPPFLGSTYRLADSIVLTPSDCASQVGDDRTVASPVDLDSQTRRWSYLLKPAENDL